MIYVQGCDQMELLHFTIEYDKQRGRNVDLEQFYYVASDSRRVRAGAGRCGWCWARGAYGLAQGYGLLRFFESPHIQASAIVVADVAEKYSHWTAVQSLGEWCKQEGIPAITGVDTRAIVTFLREEGSSLAKLTVGEEYDADEYEAFIDPEQINLVKRVSTKAPFHVRSSTEEFHVAVLDCGVKENILRSLVSRGGSITALPYDFPIQCIATHFDGLFVSNGPGDPTHLHETVRNLCELMADSHMPVMGVCMGHQLLALAAGARTLKMQYGNRAHNIPALDLNTGRAIITSQNHGYAVDAATLPSDWKEFPSQSERRVE
ncbi:MAG: Multifunctional pyrimidine synthesis protein CAD [Bogoriella megaspora]|nr:MAG: Multifunctional pyrimidine synthesis protein CAD [Bogoriella megaspora]